jgi:hypothetical protein
LERQDWMKCPTQVNCRRHRKRRRAKDADRLQPNRQCSWQPQHATGAHGQTNCRCVGRD